MTNARGGHMKAIALVVSLLAAPVAGGVTAPEDCAPVVSVHKNSSFHYDSDWEMKRGEASPAHAFMPDLLCDGAIRKRTCQHVVPSAGTMHSVTFEGDAGFLEPMSEFGCG